MIPSPASTNPSAYRHRKAIPLRTIRRIQPTRVFVRTPLKGNPPPRENRGSGPAATAHAPLFSHNRMISCNAANAPIFGESPEPMPTPISAIVQLASRRRLQDFGIPISATATHLSQSKTHRNNEQRIHHLHSPKNRCRLHGRPLRAPFFRQPWFGCWQWGQSARLARRRLSRYAGCPQSCP
jgi:hypothetical protein